MGLQEAVLEKIEQTTVRQRFTGKCIIHKELKEAIEEGQADHVTHLLSRIEDINTQIQIGNKCFGTPIEVAIACRQDYIICKLQEHGCDINLAPKRHTPLMVACIFYPDMVSCLLRYGADPNVADVFGLTALHYLAMGEMKIGRADTFKNLIEYGADVNIQSNSGSTSLSELLDSWKMHQMTRVHADESPVEFVECICHHLRAGARPSHPIEGSKSDLLITVKSLLVEMKLCPSYEEKVVTMAVLTGAITSKDTVDLYTAVCSRGGKPRVVSEFLERFLRNGLNLKETCRRTLRNVLHPPLVSGVAKIELPRPLKEYVLFTH